MLALIEDVPCAVWEIETGPDGRARRRVEDQLSALERRAEELTEVADAQQGRWEPTGRTLAQEWELRDTEGRRALLSGQSPRSTSDKLAGSGTWLIVT